MRCRVSGSNKQADKRREAACATYCHGDGQVGLRDGVHGGGDEGRFYGDLFGER